MTRRYPPFAWNILAAAAVLLALTGVAAPHAAAGADVRLYLPVVTRQHISALIAYSTSAGEIAVARGDGTAVAALTDAPDEDSQPVWSPDRRRLAFVSARDGGGAFEIYVMNGDGSGQTRLTHNAVHDWRPAWSPDGTRLLFSSKRDGAHNELYVMRADGTEPTRLTFTPAEDEAHAEWSPDGARILFESLGELYTMRADGAEVVRLTGGLVPILRAVFDVLATDYVLPDEGPTDDGAHYWLTPTGYGLRLEREQTGAVRGDAYTDYLGLLLPSGVLVSTDITEDSYQPNLVLTLTAADAGALDRMALILEHHLRQAGCEPLPG